MAQGSVSTFVRRLVVATLALLAGHHAGAQEKVVVITNWFAQAEHGGIYQALASGMYKKYGLDVTVKMGGPQVNSIQLLAADQADFIMNRDFAVLQGVSKGLPLVTVLAPMQFDAQGLLTHEDVRTLHRPEGQDGPAPATTAQQYWWPWLKNKYGYTDAQTRPYSGNLQPFFADNSVVQQAFPTLRALQSPQKGLKYEVLPVCRRRLSAVSRGAGHSAEDDRREARHGRPLRRARRPKAGRASSPIPEPAAAVIKRENPNMTDGEIAFAVQKLKDSQAVTGGDAAQLGIGAMTEARWKQTFDFMVESGLLSPSTEWRKAYTTRFIDDLKVMP